MTRSTWIATLAAAAVLNGNVYGAVVRCQMLERHVKK